MGYPNKYSLLEYPDTSAMPRYSDTADQEGGSSPAPSLLTKEQPVDDLVRRPLRKGLRNQNDAGSRDRPAEERGTDRGRT